MPQGYRWNEDRWSDRSQGDWRRNDREQIDHGQADVSRSFGDDDGRDRSNDRGERNIVGREGFEGRDEDRADRGYRPFGASGRTYYGEGRGFDREGQARFQDYGERRDYSQSGGFHGGSGYGSSSQGGERGGQGGSRGERSYDQQRDQGFGETGGRWSRSWDGGHEWGSNPPAGRGDEGRNSWDKTSDELRSWFGDDRAQRRREFDRASSPGEHRGRGPKNYARSDERIRDDVNDRLSDDSWLDASHIEVQLKDGEVTLNGTVNSRQDKRRAEDLAHDCSGVKHVQNNLRIQQAGRQDEQPSLWGSGQPDTGTLSGTGASGRA